MAAASVEVSPKSALVDEKIRVRAVNLKPSQEVTLQAWVSERGAVYTSCGQFVADGQGCVDTTQHSSIGGTYTDDDVMGLFWSLRSIPELSKTNRLMKMDVTKPLVFEIRVLDGHVEFDDLPHTSESVLASTTCERWYKHHSVRRIVVREGKLRGTLFLPAGNGPFPGVIDMFGTGVGLMEIRAALLASRGFAVFALAYFNYDDLPNTLDLDVRYHLDAVDWLSIHPSVQPGGVGVVGVSKGGELALILASESEKVRAAVNINGVPAASYSDIYKDGQPYLKALEFHPDRIEGTDENLSMRECYDYHKMNIIEAWRHNAKILYIGGGDDYTMDTKTLSRIYYLLVPDKYKKNVEIIHYPGAGHLIEPPYMPLCRTTYFKFVGQKVCWGGYPKPHAVAQEDAWRRLLKFLGDNLDQRQSNITTSRL